MKTQSLNPNSGMIVYREDEVDVLSLDHLKAQELFKSSGMLLFRGFQMSLRLFRSFVDRFTSQYWLDYGNSKKTLTPGDFIQSVTVSNHSIELHCENGIIPQQPDIIWFYCVAPAVKGGETVFCDGVRVWKHLSQPTRQMFLSHKVKHASTTPRELYLGEDKIVVLRIGDFKFAGTTYRFNDDESVTMEYITSAVKRTKYGSELAFVNSLIGPYLNHKVTFEDGSEISDEIFGEIRRLYKDLTQPIHWQAGDLAMIDNTRYMHGREAFNDNQRDIYTLMSMANF